MVENGTSAHTHKHTHTFIVIVIQLKIRFHHHEYWCHFHPMIFCVVLFPTDLTCNVCNKCSDSCLGFILNGCVRWAKKQIINRTKVEHTHWPAVGISDIYSIWMLLIVHASRHVWPNHINELKWHLIMTTIYTHTHNKIKMRLFIIETCSDCSWFSFYILPFHERYVYCI